MNRAAKGLMVAAALAMSTSGCRVVGGIFKAGFGVGIVIAIIAVGLLAAVFVGLRSLGGGGAT